MTLKEAIESGRAFRRKGQDGFYHIYDHFISTGYSDFKVGDLTSDDYELEPEKILLSAQEISDVLADAQISRHGYILKKLGFKDV